MHYLNIATKQELASDKVGNKQEIKVVNLSIIPKC